jgi:hypothetical protein
MAATSINPMNYLRHAWDATHSGWGKVCIILFYLLIWIQIIWAIEIIIFPRAGLECIYDEEVVSEYAASALVMYVRTTNILTIGFFLYADRGGIKVWNVAMVFLASLAWTWPVLDWIVNYTTLEGAPKDCEDVMGGIKWTFLALLIWSFVALVCSGMEKRATPSGSASETAPLNV